ncbi:hypothetical protein PKOR_03765 [Pontibacter korlensis]|uniref:Uncharacterized protein n=1 Tax=Pontibacter korlensis TaxID=400092 RepID=A0A0E3ZDG8_9BACT|nr:hypothetical protein PKOR_03765 [Pontibacter korlensis]
MRTGKLSSYDKSKVKQEIKQVVVGYLTVSMIALIATSALLVFLQKKKRFLKETKLLLSPYLL